MDITTTFKFQKQGQTFWQRLNASFPIRTPENTKAEDVSTKDADPTF